MERNILPYVQGKFVGLHAYSPNIKIPKDYIFTTALQKDKSNPDLFKLCDIVLLSLIILWFSWRMRLFAALLLFEKRGLTVIVQNFLVYYASALKMLLFS